LARRLLPYGFSTDSSAETRRQAPETGKAAIL